MRIKQVALIALLFLGALVVRMPGVGYHSLWFDEASTAFNITQPDLLKAINTTESTPPLFFYLEKWMIQWLKLPLSEWSLRLLPLLFDAGVCVLYFFLFSAISNKKSGFLSYLLVTLGNFSINISHDARSYSLFTLMALFSLWSTIRWWQFPGWKNTFGLIFSIGLLIQTHYYSVFWIGALFLSAGIVKFRDLKLKRYLLIIFASSFISFIILSPLLLVQSDYQFDSSKSYLLAKWLPGIVYTPVKVLIGAYLFKIKNVSEISLLDFVGIFSVILILVYASVYFFRRLSFNQVSDTEKILSYALFLAYGIHIAIGWVIPCVHPRYMEYHLVLLFGFIVVNTSQKKLVLPAIIMVLVIFNSVANYRYYISEKPYIVPWKTVGAAIDGYITKNEGIPIPVLAHYSICLPVGFYVQNSSVPFYHIHSPMNPDEPYSFARLSLFNKDFYTQLYHYRYFALQGSTTFMELVVKLRHGVIVDKVENSIETYIPELKAMYRGVIEFDLLSSIETNQGTVYVIDWQYKGISEANDRIDLAFTLNPDWKSIVK